MDNPTTFEEIDQHINSVNLTDYQPGGKMAFTATRGAAPAAGDLLTKVCGIYKVVRPILAGVVLIPFIPAKWKEAIKTFMGLLDQICP